MMRLHKIRQVYLLLQLFAKELLIFLVFYKSVTNGPTDRRTDRPTDRRTDGRTDPHIEMRGRI